MRNQTTFATILLCAGGVAAQTTKYRTSPVDYDRIDGTGYSPIHGAFPEMRIQNVDGSMKGVPAQIKSLAMRWENTRTFVQSGRSFQKVSLRVSRGSVANFTNDFGTNVIGKQTEVFSGPVSWPSGMTAARPGTADWLSGATFAFSSPFSHSGSDDILFDFRYEGGKLANSAAWSGQLNYYFDSFSPPADLARREGIEVGKPYAQGAGCFDSVATSRLSATVYLSTHHLGPNVPGPYPDTMYVNCAARNLGPSSPAVLAIGFALDFNGVQLGSLTCQRMHIDPREPIVLFPRMTTSAGWINSLSPLLGPAPAVPQGVGLPVVAQAAWNDTRTGQLKLSSAAYAPIPNVPGQAMRRATYASSGSASTGSSGATMDINQPLHNPIFRLGH